MLDQLAWGIGFAVMALLGIAAVSALAILVIDYLGEHLWAKLKSLYSLNVLRGHLRMQEDKNGIVFAKPEDE